MKTNKFRVWDKLAERFIRPDKGFQGHYTLDLNGCFYDLGNGSGGDEYVVQQYIGLLDNHGKEIYEGDIVTFKPKSDKPPFWEVKYDFGLAMFCLYNRKKERYFEYDSCIRGHICGDDVRIIGNIFENPELLQK